MIFPEIFIVCHCDALYFLAVTWSCCWLRSTAKDLLRAVLRAFIGSYLFLHLALTQQRPLYGAKGREGRNSIHTTQTCTVWWSSSLHITAQFHRSMTDIVCHVCKTGKHFSVPAAYFMLKSVIHAEKLTEQ